MEISFQLIDCDYIMVDNLPVVRLFGKTNSNKTVCAFYKGFLPYFYVLPKKESKEVTEFLEKKFSQLLVKVEEVEKYFPIGFKKKKDSLLKITLKNPSKIVTVREELRNSKLIDEIYEADILFKYRFMADFNLSGMKWVRVSGSAINTNTVKTNMAITLNSIKKSEEGPDCKLKYLGVDIEVIPGKEGIPNSKRDKIAMISLSFFPAYNGHNTLVLVSKPIKKIHKDLIVLRNEKEMLQEFIKIINLFDPDIICGYNINNFDMPFISDRLSMNKLSKNIGRCNQKPLFCRKLGYKFRNSIPGRLIVDVYDLIKESVGKGFLRLKRYGLGDVSRELLNEDKVDIAHSEIEKYWNGDESELKKLVEYSRKDAELVLKLLLEKEMLGKFIEVSKITGLLLQDVLDGGEAMRVENLLLREFNKRDFVIPCKPTSGELRKRLEEREAKGLKGALVLDPVVGLHTNYVGYLDFRSMYPSIFIAWNICPTTIIFDGEEKDILSTPYGTKFVSRKVREGIIPTIVGYLIKERNRLRKQMKNATGLEKRVLDAKQYAFKITANAFYGYTGYVRARFYVLDIANAITSCGRELIQRTKKIVERDKRFKVVYGDTDSVMVKLQTNDPEEAFKIGEEISDRINKELEGIVQIKIESIFKTLLILTKKRYAGWSFEKIDGEWKDNVIMKGIETVRRDWCDLTSKTLSDVLEILLKEQDTNKAFNYVRGVLKKLERNEVPIEDLVITKSISKSIRSYKGIQPHIELVKKLRKRSPGSAPGVGDRVGFVITQGTRLMSKRAEDPEYIRQHDLKIDSKYYIENQILPPLERVFEAIGIRKSELLGAGRQLLLLDTIRKRDIPLNEIDGFMCDKCDKIFRKPPLIGKCVDCGGEIVFYSGKTKSRLFNGFN